MSRLSRQLIAVSDAKIILVLICLLISTSIGATSFDCVKANAKIEITICKNSELSTLDEQMHEVYKKKLTLTDDAKSVIADQRFWISNIRAQCPNSECLIKAYLDRITQLKGSSTTNKACSITSQILLGHWTRVKKGDFEEFSLSTADGKNYFSSWLHHKPEFNGTWDFNSCVLHIAHSTEKKLSFSYLVMKYENDRIYFNDADDSREKSIYRRVKSRY